MSDDILNSFDEFIKLAEKAFSYEKIFDISGVSEILSKMYITTSDLNSEYVSIFYKTIKNFIKQPLYSDTSLSDEGDLKFLRTDDLFKSKINETISKIKKELDSRTSRVMKTLEDYGRNEKINLVELSKIVKLDKASLLFILDALKDSHIIYDYNGREVTTK